MKIKIQLKNGFTLLETIIAVGIFAVVISSVVGIFVSGSASQRRTIELYTIQREAGYLMETMSRELKMATGIGDDQQDQALSQITITNYEGDEIIYCRSDEVGTCISSGDYIARDGEVISSSKIKINKLIFYTSDDFMNEQPMVSVVMKVESTDRYNTEMLLQNSVVIRVYE